MAIIPRWKRLLNRDWKDPFEWFEWRQMADPKVLFRYAPMGRNYTGAMTFSRADASTCATYVDRTGTVQTVAANVLRDQHYINGQGPYLEFEGASRVNRCLQSSTLNTAPWAAVSGAPVVTEGADTSCGVALSSVSDASAVSAEGVGQTVTFVGDGTKALGVIVKQSTSTTSMIRVQDNTAPATRIRFVLTWSGGLPVVANVTGTYLGYESLAGSCFRLWFSGTGFTAANTNQLQIYPASDNAVTAALTGALLVGGVTCEDAAFPSSTLTTGAATVTRAADALYFPYTPMPQAMTLYLKFVERGTSLVVGGQVFQVGTTGASNPRLLIDQNGTGYRIFHHNGTTSVGSTLAALPAMGDTVELRLVVNADGSVQANQSINGAAESSAATTAANALPSAWAGPYLQFGSATAYIGIGALKVAAGVQSLNTMRTL